MAITSVDFVLEHTEDLPPLRLYSAFTQDWEEFPKEVRAEIGDVLAQLQCNFGAVAAAAQVEKSYYATLLQCGYALYWKPEFTDGGISLNSVPARILVLAIFQLPS